eukprot:2098282-Prymnesium_polylepis.1
MCLAGVVEGVCAGCEPNLVGEVPIGFRRLGSLARGYCTWSRRASSARVGPSQRWTFPSEQQVHTTAKVD